MREIVNYLGLPSDSPKLLKFMARVGVDLPNDLVREIDEEDGSYDSRSYVEFPDRGYCLIFTDEASFVLGKSDQTLGEGKLYFSTIFFYAQDVEDYSQYQGVLPFGLSVSMGKADIVDALGESSWQRFNADGSIAMDRWDILPNAMYRLSLNYGKPAKGIRIIGATIPDAKFTLSELQEIEKAI